MYFTSILLNIPSQMGNHLKQAQAYSNIRKGDTVSPILSPVIGVSLTPSEF